jgi:phosphoribosylglycinamide formyltransferase-1
MHFVVLSSSRGTTFEAVLAAIDDGALHARCIGLVTDQPDRGCIEKAKAHSVPHRVVERRNDEPREVYDKRLHAAIEELAKEAGIATSAILIAALGWMWILSPWFTATWKNRIINVHPSLLPKYPGAHAHEEVLKNKEKESGMTIHLIDEGVDTGTILLILQDFFVRMRTWIFRKERRVNVDDPILPGCREPRREDPHPSERRDQYRRRRDAGFFREFLDGGVESLIVHFARFVVPSFDDAVRNGMRFCLFDAAAIRLVRDESDATCMECSVVDGGEDRLECRAAR